MKRLPLDAGNLYYTDRGSGESAVLVHGGLTDSRTWQAQLEGLSDTHRVIAYNRRDNRPGHGSGDAPADDLGRDVEDLTALLERLELGPAHLVGHSWGAFVCLWLAIQKPDLVKSLVLAEPPVLPLFLSNPPKPQELIRLFAISPSTAMSILRFGVYGIRSSTAALKREGAQILARSVATPQRTAGADERAPGDVRDNLEARRSEFLANGFGPLTDSRLRRVKVPTLLVRGQDSPAFLTRLLDRLENLLPDRRRVVIDRASHFMHEENSDDFNRAVLDFWAMPSFRPVAWAS